MSYALIISDLHLSEQSPETAALFFRFLTTEAAGADVLYILGDFMEYWIGDDDLSPFHSRVIQALKTLSDQGVSIFIMRGNRDFLMGKRFIKACGAQLLRDPSIIYFSGHRVLLTHGDLLCTDDIGYQRYRRWVHKRWLQRIFLILPLRWRRKAALSLRIKSQQNYASKAQQGKTFGDVTEQAVDACCKQAGCERIIHGHTHRFGLHYRPTYQRLVLSDWHETGSYIKLSTQGIELCLIKY